MQKCKNAFETHNIINYPGNDYVHTRSKYKISNYFGALQERKKRGGEWHKNVLLYWMEIVLHIDICIFEVIILELPIGDEERKEQLADDPYLQDEGNWLVLSEEAVKHLTVNNGK
jgi:Mlc titration factor MtfA (ptsG expression regulator)